MASMEGDMEGLSRAILGEARAEVEEVKRGAQNQADAIRRAAQETAASERKAILEQANQEVRRLRSQANSGAQLRARASELEHREQLIEKVFDQAGQRLASLAERKDFDEVAVRLVRQALSQLRSDEAELLVDARSQEVLSKTALEGILKDLGVRVTNVRTLEAGTGVIARTPDGRLQFDNTLESRLSRIKDEIRSGVYKILTEEAK